MDARHGKDSAQRPGGRRPSRPRRASLAAALLALLMLSCLFGAVAPAGASAAPGRPTAKAPKGAITTTKPTFKWSKAARATRYEVRVYKGSKLLLRKTGIAKLSWKSSKALPTNVGLTWKVRARNARGNGAWSRSLKFKVTTPGPAKAITAFSFQGLAPPVIGVVTEANHTISLTVPYGTNVSALVATFATTGSAVKVGATTQVSGTTANDFTSPVTYTVTAADASTQDYVVTVTVAAPLAIGDPYQGGKLAYILQPGDPGYVAGQTHGLIAAAADQTTSDGIAWATEPHWNISVPGTSTGIGTGSANTAKIIAQNGAGTTYAAGLARAYNGGSYSDWFLPSRDELNKLYLNRVAIGGFDTTTYPYYWSSSEIEYNAYLAWSQLFDGGYQLSYFSKYYVYRVRAVRAF